MQTGFRFSLPPPPSSSEEGNAAIAAQLTEGGRQSSTLQVQAGRRTQVSPAGKSDHFQL